MSATACADALLQAHVTGVICASDGSLVIDATQYSNSQAVTDIANRIASIEHARALSIGWSGASTAIARPVVGSFDDVSMMLPVYALLSILGIIAFGLMIMLGALIRQALSEWRERRIKSHIALVESRAQFYWEWTDAVASLRDEYVEPDWHKRLTVNLMPPREGVQIVVQGATYTLQACCKCYERGAAIGHQCSALSLPQGHFVQDAFGNAPALVYQAENMRSFAVCASCGQRSNIGVGREGALKCVTCAKKAAQR